MGGQGVVSVVSNVAPKATVELYQAAERGDIRTARERLNALWDLIGFLFCDSNPVPCKAAMHQMGLCAPTVRLPLADFAGPAPTDILTRLGLLSQ